jgi:hypothetical protein
MQGAVPGAMSAANIVRGNLRRQLLGGKSVKGAALADEWMATNWPALLDAHYVLPSPGRAVALEDARRMVEHGVAQISVCKGTVGYEERKMAACEVTAVEAWLGKKDGMRSEMCDSGRALDGVEQSLSAQASYYHGVAEDRFLALDQSMKQALNEVMQPDYPESASFVEKKAFLQDRREEVNKAARRLRVEEDLVKCSKSAASSSTDTSPVLSTLRDTLRETMESYDAEIKSLQFKRELEHAETKRRMKEEALAAQSEKKALKAAAKATAKIARADALAEAPEPPRKQRKNAKGPVPPAPCSMVTATPALSPAPLPQEPVEEGGFLPANWGQGLGLF